MFNLLYIRWYVIKGGPPRRISADEEKITLGREGGGVFMKYAIFHGPFVHEGTVFPPFISAKDHHVILYVIERKSLFYRFGCLVFTMPVLMADTVYLLPSPLSL